MPITTITAIIMCTIALFTAVGVIINKVFKLGTDVSKVLDVIVKIEKHAERLDDIEDDITDFKHRLTKLEKYEIRLDKLNEEAANLKQEIGIVKGILKKTSPSIFSGDTTK